MNALVFPAPTTFGTTRTPVTHAPLEPQGIFGHPRPNPLELAALLRQRMAHTRRLDDVPVSPGELTIILDALEANL